MKKEQEEKYHFIRSYIEGDYSAKIPVNGGKNGPEAEQCNQAASGQPQDNVTAIISTLFDESGISSSIFVIGDLAYNLAKNLLRLELNESYGWIVTTHWFTSPYIRGILDTEWGKINEKIGRISKDKHKSLRQIGQIKIEATKQKEQLIIEVPTDRSFTERGDVDIVAGRFQLSSFNEGKQLADGKTSNGKPGKQNQDQGQKNILYYLELSTCDSTYLGARGPQKYQLARIAVNTRLQLSHYMTSLFHKNAW